jgi:hypothetical protein
MRVAPLFVRITLGVLLGALSAPAFVSADPAFDAFLECRYRDAISLAEPEANDRHQLLVAVSWLEEGRLALHAAHALAEVQVRALTKLMDAEGNALGLSAVPEFIESSRAFLDADVFVLADQTPADDVDWTEPADWDGPSDSPNTIPLHDPWRMAAYAGRCFARAEADMPSAEGVPEAFRSFRMLAAGRLALIAGRYGDARAAFAEMNDPAGVGRTLSAVATALEEGAIPTIDMAGAHTRALEECVAALSLGRATGWDEFAPRLEQAYRQFESDVATGRRDAGRTDIQRAQWAVGVACGLATTCVPPKSIVHLYDGHRAPGPETNPPIRIGDIVRTNLDNLNEQTTMLSLVHGAAKTMPLFTGLYDALQLYYRYSFRYRVEAPIGE